MHLKYKYVLIYRFSKRSQYMRCDRRRSKQMTANEDEYGQNNNNTADQIVVATYLIDFKS